MIQTESRRPIKNLIYTFVHWALAVLLSIVSFVVQYSFLIDTGETYSSIIFSGSIYRVNFVTFFIGVAIFFVGFYFIWKKYLSVDWKAFAGQFWMWKVAYVMLALFALCAMFFAGVMALFLRLGLSGDIRPVWTTWGFAVFPIYTVLVAVGDWFVSRKKS